MSIQGVVVKDLERREDERGWLFEAWRCDGNTKVPEMTYVSFTNKGVTRGPHEHVYQTDMFVFLGKFRLMLWDARADSPTFKNVMTIETDIKPVMAIVPPGVVHAYKALEDGLVLNMPDRLYAGWRKTHPVDEIRHEADPESPYKTEK